MNVRHKAFIIPQISNALRSADEKSAAHGFCETRSRCWQCGGLLPKLQVGFATHRVIYGQCVGCKALCSVAPALRACAGREEIIGKRFHTHDIFVRTQHIGVFHSPLLLRKERSFFLSSCSCDMWKQVNQTRFKSAKNGFWDFAAAGNPEAGSGLARTISVIHWH